MVEAGREPLAGYMGCGGQSRRRWVQVGCRCGVVAWIDVGQDLVMLSWPVGRMDSSRLTREYDELRDALPTSTGRGGWARECEGSPTFKKCNVHSYIPLRSTATVHVTAHTLCQSSLPSPLLHPARYLRERRKASILHGIRVPACLSSLPSSRLSPPTTAHAMF